MPRRYHSPSSIALGQRCQHLWALTYIDGIRDPDLVWRPEMERPQWDHGRGCYVLPDGSLVTAQQRGAALGKALHATAERYLDPARGEPDWAWFPGRVFRAGVHHLPRPDRIDLAVIEAPIGTIPLEPGGRDDSPQVAIEICGVRWAGYRDLLAFAPAEWRRLRVNAPDGMAVVDYKSTSDIGKHALTQAELNADGQGNVYAIDVCEDLGLRSVPGRWIYFESKRVRRSIAVDTTFELSRAYDTIGPLADLARELDQITCAADAPKNSEACSDYGAPDRINCRRHVVNGGTCDARKPNRFGPIVQIRTSKEENTMALTAEQKAKFEAKKAAAKAAAESGGESAGEGEAEGPIDESIGEGEGEAAPKPAPVKPRPTVAKAPAVTGASALSVLVKELEQHEKAAEGVRAKMRAALG